MNKIVALFVILVGGGYAYTKYSAGDLSLIPGHYTKDQFKRQIAGPGVVVVKFGANWCPPCKMMDKELENLTGNVKVVKVNIDRNRELQQEFGVSGIPHTVLFRDGKVVGNAVGYRSAAQISDWARQYGSEVTPMTNVSLSGSNSSTEKGVHANPFVQ